MSIYADAVAKIKANKKIRDDGGVIAIPWNLPRLSRTLPGVRKGIYTCVTAGTKESKTQLTDFLFMYQPIEWLLDNRDVDISLKVKYFSLELSKEVKMVQAIAYRLFTKYGILINPDNLLSVFDDYVVHAHILNIIDSYEFQEWFTFFEETVEFIDNVRHPTGIRMNIQSYAEQNGHYTYKEIDWETDGEYVKKKVVDKYVPDRPNEVVEVIVDHASLLSEKGKSLYECIKTMSSEHFIKMRDTWGYSPVLVQQQSADSTTQQFNNKGSNVLEKVRPTREGLANCKDVGMDVNLMLGIFSPYKYKEEEYEDWDLTRLKDSHRELTILLNRSGKSNATMQLYFNGACNYFRELPVEPDEKVYNYVLKNRKLEEEYAVNS